ncbi:MAG: hypothetical protein AAFY48_13705 [Bacteroidota bacterium]
MRITIILGILFTLTACASHDTKTVLVKQPTSYQATSTAGQLKAGAEAFDTDAKTKAAFDQKLVRKGIVPVQLAFKNDSSRTIVIFRDQIELASNASNSMRPMSSLEVAESVEENAIAHAVFGFGILSYGAAKDAQSEREADYANKQLPEELLIRPGRLNGGFIFFRVGKSERVSGRRVVVPFEYADTPGQLSSIELQL